MMTYRFILQSINYHLEFGQTKIDKVFQKALIVTISHQYEPFHTCESYKFIRSGRWIKFHNSCKLIIMSMLINWLCSNCDLKKMPKLSVSFRCPNLTTSQHHLRFISISFFFTIFVHRSWTIRFMFLMSRASEKIRLHTFYDCDLKESKLIGFFSITLFGPDIAAACDSIAADPPAMVWMLVDLFRHQEWMIENGSFSSGIFVRKITPITNPGAD